MKVHPAAEIFPMMGEDELKELSIRIKTNGLRNPIIVKGDLLIDGRNRLKACEMVGYTPIFKELPAGEDPIEYIFDQNIPRRHLSSSQRAMAAADLEGMTHGRTERRKDANLHLTPPVSRNEAAKLLKVSPRAVADAKKIKAESPELAEEVKSGAKTVNAAKKEIAAAKPRKMARPAPEPDANQLGKLLGQVTRFLDDWTAHHQIQNGKAHCLMLGHLSKFQEQFEVTRKGLS